MGEGMTNSDPLEEANSRLSRALGTFEEKVANLRHADLSADALKEQVETLTSNLGEEQQKCDRLSEANSQVSERIDSIIDSVKSILESH